jgi:selenide,water dikinase
LKRGLASDELVAETVRVMTELNRDASAAAVSAGASAMTDVTGFGLGGHLHELALASGVGAEIEAGAVPVIPGVIDLLDGDEPPIAGGTRRNRDWISSFADFEDSVPETLRWIVCDAMTSGGLLVALSGANAGATSAALGTRIGRLVDGEPGRIRAV